MANGRGNTELVEVVRGAAIAANATTRFSREFALGEGWWRLLLGFNHVVVIGTGAGVVAESALRIIRGITFKTDRGEVIYDNIPARPIYRMDQIKRGTLALLDAVAAASATYRTLINMWFVDPLAARPLDTVLNTARYQSVTLEITMGGVADLYTAPGTATVAPTLDILLERQKGPLPENVRPILFPYFGVLQPRDLTVAPQELNTERAANLAYRRWMAYATENGIAGIPFSGDADADAILDYDVDHDGGQPWRLALQRILAQSNKQDYSLEAAVAGQAIFDFARVDGSINSAMPSGDKSRLRLLWRNDAAGAGVRQISMAVEGVKPLQ